MALAAELRRVADDQNKGRPQYVKFWDGPEWRVARVKRDLRSKMGVGAVKGELVIAKMATSHEMRAGVSIIVPDVTYYSSRTKVNTSTKPGNVAFLEQ